MTNHVIPNDYRGLVIGIGMPDPRNFFPEKDEERAKHDTDYSIAYNDMKGRQPETTYFERLKMLDSALKGRPPFNKEKINQRFGDKLQFESLPQNKVLIVPKHPHTIYTTHYDHTYRKDLQGQLEPNKELIQMQYLFVRKEPVDGSARDRIKAKSAEQRHIPLVVEYESDMPPERKSLRDKRILTPSEQDKELKKIRGSEYELCIMPFGVLDEEQMRMIDDTLNNAYKLGEKREMVFAVPYLPCPSSESGRRNFWMEHRTPDLGSPFERYTDTKEHIEGLFEERPDEFDKISFTFVEISREGTFPIKEKSLSYLPNNFRPHGTYESYLAELQNNHNPNSFGPTDKNTIVGIK